MNKRGGAIVESAVIFPMTVMSVVSLIFIMIYFHTQLCDRVDMHILLRAESGMLCENMIYGNNVECDLPVYKETQQIYSKGIAKSDRKFLLKGHKKEFSARKYLIDESKYIRMSEVLNNE